MTDRTIYVRYRENGTSTVIEIDGEKHPPEEVLEFARARIYPDVKPLEVDPKFDAIIRQRKLDAAKAA